MRAGRVRRDDGSRALAQVTDLIHELSALRAALGRRHPAQEPPSADPGDEDPTGEAVDPGLSDILEDLKTELTELTGAAEDMVAEHPTAAVASAFLLGILVGRMTKGSARP